MELEVQTPAATAKQSRKERLIEEGKEILSIVVYLFVSLSLLSTMKALVLAQHGINDFAHCYIVALVEALALAKIVVIAQKLPLMEKFSHKPLFYSVLYKSVVMSIFINIGANIEEKIFVRHHVEPAHPIVLIFTHQVVLMIIFVALFTVRGLNKELGNGVLKKLFFGPK
ncbi:MAG: hypothetical protein IAF58_04010 [Leptolyngbya sp.]|nr:hypothetical protein [Candidatus Melainabacteria bacterium]